MCGCREHGEARCSAAGPPARRRPAAELPAVPSSPSHSPRRQDQDVTDLRSHGSEHLPGQSSCSPPPQYQLSPVAMPSVVESNPSPAQTHQQDSRSPCPHSSPTGTRRCSCITEQWLEYSASFDCPPPPYSPASPASSTSTPQSEVVAQNFVRARHVPNPLAVLPRESWTLFRELSGIEYAHVELPYELRNLRLKRGCQLVPDTKEEMMPEGRQTAASGALARMRTLVNKFYFSAAVSAPVPSSMHDIPEEAAKRNVLIFFEEIDQQHTLEKICRWATGWREHLRAMMIIGGKLEVCPSMPVVEVREGGKFFLTFIIDTGTHVFVLSNMTPIGDTYSPEGLCQLRNAAMYLNDWMADVYKPWMNKVGGRAQDALAAIKGPGI